MMTETEAAWIRDHAWTGAMRKEYREVPLSYHRCACQSGLTHWCQVGQHDRCHRATPQRTDATVICRRGGMEAAHFPEPYAHKTDTSATGPRYETTAMVWLADRVCRWVCDCECHTAEGRAAVLAWLIKTGLYPGDATEDELTPPAYRAYRAEMQTQARITAGRKRRERAAAEQAEKAAAADAEFRRTRDRREAIREWAAEHRWPTGKGRIPAATVEAYEVDQEDGAGQGALF